MNDAYVEKLEADLEKAQKRIEALETDNAGLRLALKNIRDNVAANQQIEKFYRNVIVAVVDGALVRKP